MAGVIAIVATQHKSQCRNRAQARERLAALIKQASRKPKTMTKNPHGARGKEKAPAGQALPAGAEAEARKAGSGRLIRAAAMRLISP